MKNITAQYRDLLEGKMSKSNFMRSVRMQFPDYISPVNSYEDMISILKSKRIIQEHIGDRDITSASHTNVKGQLGDYDPAARAANLKRLANFGPKEKPFYLVDASGKVLDSIMATNAAMATEYFEDQFEMGIPGSLTVTDMNPEEIDEAMDKKGIEALRKGALREAGQIQDKEEAIATLKVLYDSELELLLAQNGIEDFWTGDVDTTVNDLADGLTEKNLINLANQVGAYDPGPGEDENFGLRETRRLNEAEEKTEGTYKKVTGKEQYSVFNEIDRVNPYEFRKGLAIEMGMQYEPTPNYFTDKFNPEALAKATKKVLKNLEKEPAYYTNMISLEFEKKSGMLQKPKELKVGPDGRAKVPGFPDAKGNTEENLGKKERAKGKPEGVKEMKPSKKSMGGLKTMKSNDKLPKGVEMMKEGNVSDADIQKKYNEMFGKNPQTKFADVAKALNIPEDQVYIALQGPTLPKFESKEEKMARLKKEITHKLKMGLKGKMKKSLEEENPAMTQIGREEEEAEKRLAAVLKKKAAELDKPGTQG